MKILNDLEINGNFTGKAANITGVCAIANGGTGITKAYTSETVTAKNSTTITSFSIRKYYNNQLFVGLNIKLGAPLAAGRTVMIAICSIPANRLCPLAVYTEAGSSASLMGEINTSGNIYLHNNGTKSIPTSQSIYLDGIAVI